MQKILRNAQNFAFAHNRYFTRFELSVKEGYADFDMCIFTLKGPYADHILIPQGSTGSSLFFDIK